MADDMISLRLPAALLARIDSELARARERSLPGATLTRSDVVRTLLLEGLATREAAYHPRRSIA